MHNHLINIISSKKYLQPEIAKCIYLENQECVAIIKTIWIKLIQRKWKNILQIRKKILQKQGNIISLKCREMTDKGLHEYLIYPTLKGMLSTLKM
jgi:hypothetical protein